MAHAKLTSAEVYVCPLKRHDFAYSETCVTSEQRDEMRLPADRTRRFNQPFVIIEVVELASVLLTRSSLMEHGSRSMTPHSTACFSSTLSTVRMLLTVFGDLSANRCFRR